ncbi:MAG TPA: alkaline phosphatase PhoX [Planctomycetota bacterium]|nr:alkaline phosphatase PhoX [Planctomycetota bacterium]
MKTRLLSATLKATALLGVPAALVTPLSAQYFIADELQVGPSTQLTLELPMLRGDTPATGNGWSSTPIFTIGETAGSYQPVGILDGIYAFPQGEDSALVLVNHELSNSLGYAYTLENGTQLTGARISHIKLTRTISALGVPQVSITRMGLAYDRVYDRAYQLVTSAAQINETGHATNGFDRFCSSNGVRAGTYGFVDAIYFTGEETGKPFHPHGGSFWALDVRQKAIWAVPALGRGNWENVSPLQTGIPGTVALLLGDDSESAPLYLYVGVKDAIGDGSFLDRNGLRIGQLYAWMADNGDLTPEQFHTVNSSRAGQFVPVDVQAPMFAGQAGYDGQGYLDLDTLQAQADFNGCFSFSRPEDLATNPYDPTQAAFASTGRGQLFPSDNWGDVYVVDVDFSDLSAELVIIHDADHLPVPDAGIRNPDNLDWGQDGKVYITEDRSTNPASAFGAVTGIEASVWRLDPVTRAFVRAAVVDRTVVAPAGTTDSGVGQIGHWEASGVLDVTPLFGTLPGERLLLVDVQAHGIKDGAIGGNPLLVEGGQLLFLSKIGH